MRCLEALISIVQRLRDGAQNNLLHLRGGVFASSAQLERIRGNRKKLRNRLYTTILVMVMVMVMAKSLALFPSEQPQDFFHLYFESASHYHPSKP